MINLGQYHSLKIIKKLDFGYFLDGEVLGEILLPKRGVDPATAVGDVIAVFLYKDSEDRIVATTLRPNAVVGDCAHLRVVEINRIGAFLDWGLPKDLLVPFNEQQKPMQEGRFYTVYLLLDQCSQRIVASSRLEDHLHRERVDYSPGQAVELMIYGSSDLGFKAIINATHLGQLYHNETFRSLRYGERITGYIKHVRPDGKIDLSLQAAAEKRHLALTESIVTYMKTQGGISRLTDKSPPAEIYATFGASKKAYKKALGELYKNRRICIQKHQLILLDTQPPG